MKNYILCSNNLVILLGTFTLVVILFSSCVLPYAFTVSESDGSPVETPYPESQFMLVEGILVHYRILLPSNPVPERKIFLVHGLGGSTYSFDQMIPNLVAEGYVVVAVDLPSFGYSGRPKEFDHSQASRAKILWNLLGEIDRKFSSAGLSETPWHLVGHSMGGGTVAAMAALESAKSASMTLIAGALEDNRTFLMALIHFPPYARWAQLFLERSLLTEDRVTKILEDAYGRPPTMKEVKAYLLPLQLPGTARSLTSFSKTSKSIPLPLLGKLTLPVSAIWGEFDTVVPLEKSRTIGKYLPQMRLYIIEGSSHIPMETHAEECNAALLEFLSDY